MNSEHQNEQMLEEVNTATKTDDPVTKKNKFFSPLEIIAIVVTLLLVVILLLTTIDTGPAFVGSSFENYVTAGLVNEIYNQPENEDERSYRQNAFGASPGTYFLMMEPNASETEVEAVNNIFQFVVPKLHALTDRHNYYSEGAIYPEGYFNTSILAEEIPLKAKKVDSEEANTAVVKNSTRINNLRVINESLNQGPVDIPYELYNILKIGQDLTIKTQSAFNMFVGELSLWWNDQIDSNIVANPLESEPMVNEASRKKVDELQSYIPLSKEEVEAALCFTEKDGHYYVEFNSPSAEVGELSITLGAIAKGYSNELLVELLEENELNRGFFFGSASSIDILSPYFKSDEGWQIVVSSNSVANQNNNYNSDAFGIAYNAAPYAISTSGGDQPGKNYYYTAPSGQTYHRHHIIDAKTGEPANYQIVDVNVLSSYLSGTALDALTTALMCLSIADGKALVEQINEAYVEEVPSGDVALRACWLTREKHDAPFAAYATNDYFDYIVPLNNIKISKI